jgi:hypothetical protein
MAFMSNKMIIDFTQYYTNFTALRNALGKTCTICNKEYYVNAPFDIEKLWCKHCKWTLKIYRNSAKQVRISSFVYGPNAIYESPRNNQIGCTINMNEFGKLYARWVGIAQGQQIDLRKAMCLLKNKFPQRLTYKR